MKQTVLIVDDELNIRNLMGFMFEQMGFAVHKVSNGKEAQEILRRESVSIIYLDLAMPDMGGDELMQWMAKDDKLKLIPIVIDTAQGNYRLPKIQREFEGKLRFVAFNRPTPPELITDAVKKLLAEVSQ